MLGLPVLDVAIGMAFLYLLFALMCTTLNEILAGAFDKRAKMLKEGVRNLVGSDLADTLYQHPAIASLAMPRKDGAVRPSYIPGDRFAQALADHITGASPVDDMAAVKSGVATLPPLAAKQVKILLERSSDPDDFHKKIAEWYEQTMDRVGGWYKRYIQKQTYVLAAILVLCLNLDSVHLVQRLWSDSALRSTVLEAAKTRVQASGGTEQLPLVEYTEGDKPDSGHPVHTGTATLTDSEKELLSSLTGWKPEWTALCAQRQLRGNSASLSWAGDVVAKHILGWVLTVLAVSLGAPFWFDTLNRFMNLRNAGRAPDEPRSKANKTGEVKNS